MSNRRCRVKQIIFYVYFATNVIDASRVKSNVENIRDIPISGNRSIEECIDGKPYWDSKSELFITTSQLIRKLGYPAEEHLLLTEDGYLLTMHRIPGAPGAPPVFLKHGLTLSSFDWVASGKDAALALVLSDRGYDVWIGNSRGCTYSLCHTRFTTSEYKYWDFSWHEMGIYDLPTEITYITNVTKQDVIYVGHSMGTTMFYVMAIERPDIASKVKAMFALASVAYISKMTFPLPLVASQTHGLWRKIISGDLYPQTALIKIGRFNLYTLSWLQKVLTLSQLVYVFGGFEDVYSDPILRHRVLYHTPAGSSVKAAIHYFQELDSGRFQYYDYGRKGNLKRYNNPRAPDYNLSKINVPIASFRADNDALVNVKDLQKFFAKVPRRIIDYRIEDPSFDHADFVWSKKAAKFLYPTLLPLMEKYK